ARALQPSGIVIIAGAALALVGSFLEFVGNGRVNGVTVPGSSNGPSAWSTDGSFPTFTLPAILAIVVAVVVALAQAGPLDGRRTLIGVTLDRWMRALALTAAALMLCFLLGEPLFSGFSADREIGFWLMLVGTLAVAV